MTTQTLGVSDFVNANNATLFVRLSRPLRFRLWLAVLLTRVVCWLIGANLDIPEGAK